MSMFGTPPQLLPLLTQPSDGEKAAKHQGGDLFKNVRNSLSFEQDTSKEKRKRKNRLETVGIEPTTFHMYSYAKRLNRVLVRCWTTGEVVVEAYKSYPLESLLVEWDVGNVVW
jgi:hypothetical protein